MKKSGLMFVMLGALALTACGSTPAADSTKASETPKTSVTSAAPVASDKASVAPAVSTAPAVTKHTVTFNVNGGSAVSALEVEEGKTATKPADPTRSGYSFDGWYTDEGCTNSFDFSTPVTADLTLYASWLDSSVTYYTITLNYNYDSIVKNYKVEENDKLTEPAADEREGYTLEGWYSDEALTTRAIYGMKIKADMTLYARWLKTTVMEAELNPNLWDMSGPGFSGAASDKSMVVADDPDYPMGASNGYYVSYLYSKGLTFEFDFTCSEAVDNVTLIARWSAEMKDFDIDGDTYQVAVNDVSISYDTISFTNVPGMGAQQKHSFDDYTLSTTVSLVEGDNKIVLTTNNDIAMGATATAAAPLVDCLKLCAVDTVTIDYEEDSNLTVGR